MDGKRCLQEEKKCKKKRKLFSILRKSLKRWRKDFLKSISKVKINYEERMKVIVPT